MEAKNLRSWLVFQLSLTMESSMSHSVIVTPSPILLISMKFMVVSNLVESLFIMTSDQNVFSGSPWGAGTFASPNGSRQPTELELKIATIQGKAFWETVKKVNF